MVKYENGKIYKIVCNTTKTIYIGSTVNTLCERLSGHKYDYINNETSKKNLSSSKVLENNDFEIFLIKLFPCNTREELLMEERRFIEELECVNQTVPIRTNEESAELRKQRKKNWHAKNRESNNEKQNLYREKNKEVMQEKERIYYKENVEKINARRHIYETENRDHINKRTLDYYHANFDAISEKRNAIYKCECGLECTNSNKNRHFKSQKHLKRLIL